MSQKPAVYAELLASRMDEHKTRCVLLNTGWSGGAYGKGDRMSLEVTRTLLNGDLDDVDTTVQQQLGLRIPISVDGVDGNILNPRNTWDDPEVYDEAAAKLRSLFQATYEEKGYAALGIDARM